MKYIKMLSLAAVAALMAFVGASTASATVLCKTTATTGCVAGTSSYPAGTVIKLVATGTMIYETLQGEVLWECTGSTIETKTSNAGGATETVFAPISSLTWSNCTKETMTLVGGELELHHVTGGPQGAFNGTLTGKNAQWTIGGIFGASCVYGFGAGVDLGTLKGGSPATISINTIIPRISGGFLCPTQLRWTASYEATAPKPLYIAEN